MCRRDYEDLFDLDYDGEISDLERAVMYERIEEEDAENEDDEY